MLHSIIAGALRQRLILVVVALVLVGFGINAVGHLSVDAFPDVANVQVQIATEAAGKSPDRCPTALMPKPTSTRATTTRISRCRSAPAMMECSI